MVSFIITRRGPSWASCEIRRRGSGMCVCLIKLDLQRFEVFNLPRSLSRNWIFCHFDFLRTKRTSYWKSNLNTVIVYHVKTLLRDKGKCNRVLSLPRVQLLRRDSMVLYQQPLHARLGIHVPPQVELNHSILSTTLLLIDPTTKHRGPAGEVYIFSLWNTHVVLKRPTWLVSTSTSSTVEAIITWYRLLTHRDLKRRSVSNLLREKVSNTIVSGITMES